MSRAWLKFGKQMSGEKAYIIPDDKYSFRPGKMAEVIGVKFIEDNESVTRLCYTIEFPDGYIEAIPIFDHDHYTIAPGSRLIFREDDDDKI